MDIDQTIELLKKKYSLKSGDCIYIVTHQKKKTFFEVLRDFLCVSIFSTLDAYKGGLFRFLVARDDGGMIIGVNEQDEIKKIVDIPQWTMELKNDFSSIVIEGIRYKKVRKVLID